MQEFTGIAIQEVEESVAVSHGDDLPRAASYGGFGQHRNFRSVPVVHVMRCELEMPLESSGSGFQRKERAGVEIVAGANAGIGKVRARIAGPPINEFAF